MTQSWPVAATADGCSDRAPSRIPSTPSEKTANKYIPREVPGTERRMTVPTHLYGGRSPATPG
ncbi:hypothetical protein JCM3263A_18520 [Thermobifida fusca]